MKPYIYGQLIFYKEPKKFSGERVVFSTNDVGIMRYPYAKKIAYRRLIIILNHTPYTEANSKWRMELSIKDKTKNSNGNVKENIFEIGLDKDFLAMPLK